MSYRLSLTSLIVIALIGSLALASAAALHADEIPTDAARYNAWAAHYAALDQVGIERSMQASAARYAALTLQAASERTFTTAARYNALAAHYSMLDQAGSQRGAAASAERYRSMAESYGHCLVDPDSC
jgi:hypothetical protein